MNNNVTTVTVSVPPKNPTWLHLGIFAYVKREMTDSVLHIYDMTKNQLHLCFRLISSSWFNPCNFRNVSARQLQSCKLLSEWKKKQSLGLSTQGTVDIREVGYRISRQHSTGATSTPHSSLASITVMLQGRRACFISILAPWRSVESRVPPTSNTHQVWLYEGNERQNRWSNSCFIIFSYFISIHYKLIIILHNNK